MPTTSRSPTIWTSRSCIARPGSEPIVEPSQFWVTERFKEALERTPSFYRAEPIEAGVRAERRSPDGRFNVRKLGSDEEDCCLRLFRIVEPRR
jgi:hypothetical protein